MSKLETTTPELDHGATRNNIIMILTPTNWPQPVGPRHQHQPPQLTLKSVQMTRLRIRAQQLIIAIHPSSLTPGPAAAAAAAPVSGQNECLMVVGPGARARRWPGWGQGREKLQFSRFTARAYLLI